MAIATVFAPRLREARTPAAATLRSRCTQNVSRLPLQTNTIRLTLTLLLVTRTWSISYGSPLNVSSLIAALSAPSSCRSSCAHSVGGFSRSSANQLSTRLSASTSATSPVNTSTLIVDIRLCSFREIDQPQPPHGPGGGHTLPRYAFEGGFVNESAMSVGGTQ